MSKRSAATVMMATKMPSHIIPTIHVLPRLFICMKIYSCKNTWMMARMIKKPPAAHTGMSSAYTAPNATNVSKIIIAKLINWS